MSASRCHSAMSRTCFTNAVSTSATKQSGIGTIVLGLTLPTRSESGGLKRCGGALNGSGTSTKCFEDRELDVHLDVMVGHLLVVALCMHLSQSGPPRQAVQAMALERAIDTRI